MVVAIGNYLLAQLTAMGLLLQSMTTFEPQTAFGAGVILLAVIMLVYEDARRLSRRGVDGCDPGWHLDGGLRDSAFRRARSLRRAGQKLRDAKRSQAGKRSPRRTR